MFNFKRLLPKRLSPVAFVQSLYLNVSLFFANDLMSSASACAFGFLFSFIPVSMMIFVILFRFLHATPDVQNFIVSQFDFLSGFTSTISRLNESFDSISSITSFEVVLLWATIWMSRRCFSSTFTGLDRIFGEEQKSKGLTKQLLIFALEAITLIMISAGIFLVAASKSIVKLDFLAYFMKDASVSFQFTYTTIVSIFPYILIFLISLLMYKYASRTKPSWGSCIIASLGTTFSFKVLLFVFQYFVNLNRYNFIYGFLSNVIVLLLEVFSFFILFFFFAQWIFVFQFFETLLVCEIYLLPDSGKEKRLAEIKRLLFIRPDYLMKNSSNVIDLTAGEYIYKKGDRQKYAYYVAYGLVKLSSDSKTTILTRGDFFGEEYCLLNRSATEDAVAVSAVKIISIPDEVFMGLLERNPKVGKKALYQINNYINEKKF